MTSLKDNDPHYTGSVQIKQGHCAACHKVGFDGF